MRFVVFRKADAETEAGALPTTQLIADMTAYNERLVKSGVMLMGEGLTPSRRGARVKFDAGKPSVIDGPFAETKELVAGFSVLEAPSLEAVIELIKDWPQLDGHGNVEIEIRPIITAADFGEAFTPELQRKEEELRRIGEANSRK